MSFIPPDTTLYQARAKAVAAIAHAMADKGFPPGDLAQLRRLDPDSPNRPAFWKLLVDLVQPEELRRTAAAERGWAMLMAAMAILGPGCHRRDVRAGTVLAHAGFSEARFEHLLRVEGERFWDDLRRLCRFLAARDLGFDWVRLAPLLVPFGEEEAERTRRELARDYYTALRRAETTAATAAKDDTP